MPRARSFTSGMSALAALTRRRGLAGKQRLNNAQTKGDKVKPAEQFAKAAVTSKTGRFATLRGPHAQGSSAPARSLVAAPLLVLCVSLPLAAGVAQAEPPKLVSYGSFSAQQPFAAGLAVGGSGDLFVAGLFPPQGLSAVPSTVVK